MVVLGDLPGKTMTLAVALSEFRSVGSPCFDALEVTGAVGEGGRSDRCRVRQLDAVAIATPSGPMKFSRRGRLGRLGEQTRQEQTVLERRGVCFPREWNGCSRLH